MEEVQLPADPEPNDFWVGFVLDWGSSTIQSFQNDTGNSSVAEDFVRGRGDYQLPPAREVRRLVGHTAESKRVEQWQEQLQKDLNSEKVIEIGQCLVTS